MGVNSQSIAIPTVSMELHTSCDSDSELGKQQGQGYMLTCQPWLLLRLLRWTNSTTAWYVEGTYVSPGDTRVFLWPGACLSCMARTCPLWGTRHLRQRHMIKSSLFRTLLLAFGTKEWTLVQLRYKEKKLNGNHFRTASHTATLTPHPHISCTACPLLLLC